MLKASIKKMNHRIRMSDLSLEDLLLERVEENKPVRDMEEENSNIDRILRDIRNLFRLN